ncbi:MAG: alcohol dehydrogenase catalytic domain-containing protein [Planctomycetota bacterium]
MGDDAARVLAVTFQGVREVRVVDVASPRLEDPRDAIVRVTSAAICGSDLHPYRGHEVGLDRGTVLGHEFVGEIVAVGAAVSSPRVGQRVASPFSTSCGDCFFCRSGLPCRCTKGALFGWVADGRGLHGAQAGFVRVPLAESTLVPIPDGVGDELALLAGDVLATGSFGVELLGTVRGSSVAVIGVGPVGACAIWAASRAGAAVVFAVDRDDRRLELARAYGAVAIDAHKGDPASAIRRATDGRGVDGVVEAVGSPAATRTAFDSLRFGGTLAAVGVHTEAVLAISPVEAYDRNLTYRAGRCPARRFVGDLLETLRHEGRELAGLFSHRMTIENAAEGYRMFDERRDGCTKVLLTP